MALTPLLTISPTSLTTFPPVLINNWARKVEIETAYITAVDKAEDGTESRRGLTLRPRRFLYVRLSAMDREELARLTTFCMRVSDQVSPVPLYADIVEVSSRSGNLIFGDFRWTRFFTGSRIAHFGLRNGDTDAPEILTVEAVTNEFIRTTETPSSVGGWELVVPLIDCDIELASVRHESATDRVGSVDLNVNEKMDESALIPLTTPVRSIVLEDDFEGLVLDTINWPSQSGTVSIVNGALRLVGASSLESAVWDTSGDVEWIVDATTTAHASPSSLFSMRMNFEASDYVQATIGYSSGWKLTLTGGFSQVIDLEEPDGVFRFLRTGDYLVILQDGQKIFASSGMIASNLQTVLMSTSDASTTIDVEETDIYAGIDRVFAFNPQILDDVPVFDVGDHNWTDTPAVDFMRYGTKVNFGRGRLVTVSSDRPQLTWSVKRLMNREEAFSLLRFFDYCRGRLAPFWYVNYQRLWKIVSTSVSGVVIEGDSQSPDDIKDFFPHVAVTKDGELPQIASVVDVVVNGDNLSLSFAGTIDTGVAWDYLTSAHLCRFGSDSIREVWSTREVCEVAFDVKEVLDEPPQVDDFIWGGEPNAGTTEFVFGGFPDTVYTLNGYFGGEVDNG